MQDAVNPAAGAANGKVPPASIYGGGPVRPVDHRFSQRYAGQNEQDYQAFTDAVRTGRITALEGI